MNSPSARSPSYRNVASKHKHSPIELKEKMRKNYKDKVQNCRNMLLNKLRGTDVESDLRETLTEIYESMFNFTDPTITDEENEIMEEIRNELVQEELQWCIEEHEKSHTDDIDWSSLEQDNVICPVCQKHDLKLNVGNLTCLQCKYKIQCHKSLHHIKQTLTNCIEKHACSCNHQVQFAVVPELNDNHIYLICDICMEMQLVI